MTKRSDTPVKKVRQSYVAIIMMLIKTYQRLIKTLWPILIYTVLKNDTAKAVGIPILLLIVVLGSVYAIIKFFRYYYYINGDELVIEQGVFTRSRTNIPFERIQSINLEENIIHQLFDVTRVKIETAGSSNTELEFQALEKPIANELRTLILSKKQTKKEVSAPTDFKVESPVFSTIMSVSPLELLKAGMVENHLKSGGIIIAFLFWMWQSAQDFGMQDRIEGEVSAIDYGVALVGFLIGAFLIISFLISLVRMVLNNFDLKFMRSPRGFKINAGLLNRRDISALDHKIQIVSWSDNMLKKLIGIKDLRFRQASSKEAVLSKSVRIPGCTTEHIQKVTDALYGRQSTDDITFAKIHPAYFYRVALYVGLIGTAIVGVLIYLELYNASMIALFFICSTLVTRYLSFKKKKYGYNNEMLMLYGGAYGDKTELLPIYKIQAFSINVSPYQTRIKLASLELSTASGKVTIPYIAKSKAVEIVDTLLYKVETDKRAWM